MIKYTYTVYRENNSVHYSLFRNGNKITTNEVKWIDLNMVIAIFWVENGSEKCINKLMEKAHRLAKFAVKTLECFES